MKRIIMVENETGALANITKVLADDNINIETLDAEGIDERGIIILTRHCTRANTRVSEQLPTMR